MANGARALGLPIGLLQFAKDHGCEAFRANGSFSWPELREFISEQILGAWGAVPGHPIDFVASATRPEEVGNAVHALRFYFDDETARDWLDRVTAIAASLAEHADKPWQGAGAEFRLEVDGIDFDKPPLPQISWFLEEFGDKGGT